MLEEPIFNPTAWFWQVAGRSDYWSSASGAYVETLPEGWFATIQDAVDAATGEDLTLKIVTPIASEADLSDVLRPHGLRGPSVSIADVETERARRLAAGFDYDFGDDRGIHRIGTTLDDMQGWDEVTKFANALVAIGDTATTILIATNSGAAEVTAFEWQHILVAAGAFRQPIWQASFALENLNPIPADYDDDARWVAAE
jgi:hypothetical protein